MTFGDAVDALKRGYTIRRDGWASEHAIRLFPTCSMVPTECQIIERGGKLYRCLQIDILANDWEIVTD